MLKCPICGGSLSEWNGRAVCSDACKQKKHRMKKGFGKSAINITAKLAEMTRAVEMGVIEREQAVITYNDLMRVLNRLYDALSELPYSEYD